MSKLINALFLGDVFGQPGCRAIFLGLKQLKSKYKADIVIVNGENACDGFGITPEIANQIFSAGADVITTGNHVWQQDSILEYLDTKENILRPQNYPPGVPGKGMYEFEHKVFGSIFVINLQGRNDLSRIDCPFREAKNLLKKIGSDSKLIFIDFHAESVDEKEALALYLDGKVTAIVGTHTHIPTADERIFPGGTAYQTDLGMSGPFDSVIGCKPEISIERSRTQMPLRMEVAETNAVINGLFVQAEPDSGKAVHVERVRHYSTV